MPLPVQKKKRTSKKKTLSGAANIRIMILVIAGIMMTLAIAILVRKYIQHLFNHSLKYAT